MSEVIFVVSSIVDLVEIYRRKKFRMENHVPTVDGHKTTRTKDYSD